MRLRLGGSGSRVSSKISRPRRGLGDLVKIVAQAVGVKPCGGCKKRAKVLNTLTGKLRF